MFTAVSYLVSTREQAATAAQKARASMLAHSRRTRSMPMLQLRAQIEAAVRSSGGAVAPAVAAAPGSRRSSVAGTSLSAAAAQLGGGGSISPLLPLPSGAHQIDGHAW